MCAGRICYESVLERSSRIYATLIESSSTIRSSCPVLEHPVKMYSKSFIAQLIVCVYNNFIA